MAVTVNRADLDFILAQIQIAEAHAAGTPLFGPGGLVPAYNVSAGLRTVDGTYNHLVPGQETWGAADQQFAELLAPAFRPGYNPSNIPASMVVDSSIRTTSNLIVDQTLGNPSAILTALQRAESADQMADLAAVTAIYETFKPAADAEYQARVVSQNAQAAADDLGDGDPGTPPTPAEQIALDAAAAAAAAHALTVDALEAARVIRDAAVAPFGIVMEGDNVSLPNISPDEGLSASFNSWFTLFGQFFDHGLDLVNKGGSGIVFVPLQPDDPLYVEGSPTNFMVLTRATVSAGTDNIMGTADDVRPVNTTTSFVDQNQTYASHSSHQVFLRQYQLNVDGEPVATGKLIEGGNGGMATWAEVKAQALLLGIELTDFDVGSVPLLRTDQYGNFIPNAAGFAQVITGIGLDGIPNTADDSVVSGTPGAPVNPTTALALRTGHAFLADIAHEAVPIGKIADGDITIGLGNPGNGDVEYDNELLDAHFIAGDGRVNENIGLTAVHHVFHAEHNRMVDHNKQVILATGDLVFINEWLVDDIAVIPADLNTLVWDGERLFQSAKFTTEMQYQHLVFEEFARKIQPQINPFLVPDGFDITINPSIVAEFAHVVYRFGHSMLTESIDRYDATFNPDHIGLIQGFLNPIAFDSDHAVTDDVAAGAIIRGMTRQVGNEIDEFVTSALRNNLLGLPLDLATINLARGRDTGVPSLNAARREFYEATNNAVELKPYDSWVEFAGNLKNEASIINFIAAYGTHALITGETTLEGKRAATLAIITGLDQVVLGDPGTADDRTIVAPGDAVDFLNSTGLAWSSAANGVTNTGLDNVDLWIGGLAEKILPFGGMLGSTFNFVFENQMENLQNGDRFYYLQRLDGLHLFGEMENNSFAEMIMTNTAAAHLPSDVFSTPGLALEVDPTRQFNDLDGDGDLEGGDPVGGGILTPLVSRNNPATVGTDTNYLRYTGDEHVVLGGTDGNDVIVASIGDDTIHGDGGRDNLEGGAGNDIINGGSGDDIIRDLGGDDNIKAGSGNDVVHGGPGLDLILGGEGQDFIVLGTDAGSEVFAGEGNDFILGSKNAERILGNEGDDWIEIGTFDGAPGDSFDEIFARDGIRGHDVFFGDGGFDEFIAEGGDDIMVGSPGPGKLVGMSGFDWATYKNGTAGVNADFFRLAFDENPLPPPLVNLETYESVEGLSGSRFGDTLSGSDEDATTLVSLADGGSAGFYGSVLDTAGIARIAGLQEVVGAGVTSFGAGDIILGGDGSDVITGRGGNDIIDGDKWLNVRISVRAGVDANGNPTGAEIASHNSMTTLVSSMFSGAINPGQLQIVREIVSTADLVADVDTAVYRGARANYDIGVAPGVITVTDLGDGVTDPVDGTDTLYNIERLQFTDGTVGVVVGTAGNDTLTGSTIDDLMFGLAGNDTMDGLAGNDTINGDLGNDTINGNGGSDIVNGGGGNDSINGGAGNDTLNGDAGNDSFTYNFGQGVDSVNGGGGTDSLAIIANGGDQVLDVVRNGAVITQVEGGAVTAVEIISANMGAGIDTLSYGASTAAATVNLASSTASGFSTLTNVENVTGGAGGDTLTGNALANVLNGGGGNDTLDGGAGADTLNGGAGADLLIGGAGADSMDSGAVNDNVQDIFRFSATSEFGDTVTNFDANGVDGVDDRVQFGGALNTAWDDIGVNNDNFAFATGNGAAGAVAANLTTTVEALLLTGTNNEGVTTANLGNAGLVSAAFNTEFTITAASGQDALLVVNDTNGNSFGLWQFVQSVAGTETSAAELSLIGIFTANAAVTAGNFDFV